MPIEISCESCSGQFRLPDSAAGKKIRCPKCKGPIEVPAAESPAAAPTEVFVPLPAVKPAAKPQPVVKQPFAFVPLPAAQVPPSPAPPPPIPAPPADEWYLQTADGEEFGPVPRGELDDWFGEGRITVDCQLRSAADEHWQAAADVYPELIEAPEDAVAAELPPAVKIDSPRVGPPKGSAKSAAPKAKQPQPAAEADADRSQRSRMVAGFLGLFLGPLGIHRFYLGYWGVGLAMLFTAGGLGLWSLIDAAFVMLGRVPDADGRPLSD
jgi:TM2 domain